MVNGRFNHRQDILAIKGSRAGDGFQGFIIWYYLRMLRKQRNLGVDPLLSSYGNWGGMSTPCHAKLRAKERERRAADGPSEALASTRLVATGVNLYSELLKELR